MSHYHTAVQQRPVFLRALREVLDSCDIKRSTACATDADSGASTSSESEADADSRPVCSWAEDGCGFHVLDPEPFLRMFNSRGFNLSKFDSFKRTAKCRGFVYRVWSADRGVSGASRRWTFQHKPPEGTPLFDRSVPENDMLVQRKASGAATKRRRNASGDSDGDSPIAQSPPMASAASSDDHLRREIERLERENAMLREQVTRAKRSRQEVEAETLRTFVTDVLASAGALTGGPTSDPSSGAVPASLVSQFSSDYPAHAAVGTPIPEASSSLPRMPVSISPDHSIPSSLPPGGSTYSPVFAASRLETASGATVDVSLSLLDNDGPGRQESDSSRSATLSNSSIEDDRSDVMIAEDVGRSVRPLPRAASPVAGSPLADELESGSRSDREQPGDAMPYPRLSRIRDDEPFLDVGIDQLAQIAHVDGSDDDGLLDMVDNLEAVFDEPGSTRHFGAETQEGAVGSGDDAVRDSADAAFDMQDSALAFSVTQVDEMGDVRPAVAAQAVRSFEPTSSHPRVREPLEPRLSATRRRYDDGATVPQQHPAGFQLVLASLLSGLLAQTPSARVESASERERDVRPQSWDSYAAFAASEADSAENDSAPGLQTFRSGAQSREVQADARRRAQARRSPRGSRFALGSGQTGGGDRAMPVASTRPLAGGDDARSRVLAVRRAAAAGGADGRDGGHASPAGSLRTVFEDGRQPTIRVPQRALETLRLWLQSQPTANPRFQMLRQVLNSSFFQSQTSGSAIHMLPDGQLDSVGSRDQALHGGRVRMLTDVDRPTFAGRGTAVPPVAGTSQPMQRVAPSLVRPVAAHQRPMRVATVERPLGKAGQASVRQRKQARRAASTSSNEVIAQRALGQRPAQLPQRRPCSTKAEHRNMPFSQMVVLVALLTVFEVPVKMNVSMHVSKTVHKPKSGERKARRVGSSKLTIVDPFAADAGFMALCRQFASPEMGIPIQSATGAATFVAGGDNPWNSHAATPQLLAM